MGKKLASMKQKKASHHTAWGCAALSIVQSYNPRSIAVSRP